MRLLILFLFFFLNSCATKEYLEETNKCLLEGYNKFPVVIEKVTKHETRAQSVYIGEKCTNYYVGGRNGSVSTICSPQYSSIYVPYTYVEDVDINKKIRKSFVRSCADNNCLEIYGNRRCKSK